MQFCGSLSILWHCFSLGLEWKLTFSSPVDTAEFSKFAGDMNGILTAPSFRIWKTHTCIYHWADCCHLEAQAAWRPLARAPFWVHMRRLDTSHVGVWEAVDLVRGPTEAPWTPRAWEGLWKPHGPKNVSLDTGELGSTFEVIYCLPSPLTQKNYTKEILMTQITTMVWSLTQSQTSWNSDSSGP